MQLLIKELDYIQIIRSSSFGFNERCAVLLDRILLSALFYELYK